MCTRISRAGHHHRPHRRPPMPPRGFDGRRFGDLTMRPNEVRGEGNQVANVNGDGNVVNSPTIIINNGNMGDQLAYGCGNYDSGNTTVAGNSKSNIFGGLLGSVLDIASSIIPGLSGNGSYLPQVGQKLFQFV